MTFPPDAPSRPGAWTCHAGDVAFTITARARWLAAQRAFLSEFVTAPPGDLDLGSFSIRVHDSDAAYHQAACAAASGAATTRIEPVPGVVMLESAEPSGRRHYVITADEVEHQPGAYAVTAEGRRISLFLHSAVPRPHRYPVRLIREAMLRTYEDAGAVIFHAACVDVGGAGVMICGPRGAGKTTMAAALLRSAGAALLANDRVLALPGGRLVAVPLPVPAGRGTIEAFPELEQAARRAPAGTGGPAGLPAGFGSAVKHSFTARQFAAAFGAGLAPASALRLVVIARLADTRDPARLRRLPKASACRILAESCFTPRDEFWARPWLVPRLRDDHELRHQADAAVAGIAAGIPCVEVSFGVRSPVADLARAADGLAAGLR
jgi:hypothetical protein